MNKTFLAFGCCALAMFSALASDLGWKVGVAKVKITPEKPIWIMGYGSRDHVMEGVRQDVWAKALALEDKDGRVGVIVTMDLCSIPRLLSDMMRDTMKEKYGLGREQIILNVSHTHSGPMVGFEPRIVMPLADTQWEDVYTYSRWLSCKVVGLAGEALASRRPASISTGNGICRFAVNRRKNKEGKLTATTILEGSRDYSVPVMKVEDESGRELAILFGYACHGTVLCDYLINGDWPGYAQQEVEKAHPGAIAMFAQGAAGDQNPLPRRKVSLAVQYGRELAAAVEQTLTDGLSRREPVLSMKYVETPLERGEPMSVERLEKIVKSGKNPDDWPVRCAKDLLSRIARGEKFVTKEEYPISYWKIGDQKLFALAGEIMSGYSVAIKEKFGADTFVWGYSNDQPGYLPMQDSWDEGGYEVDSSFLSYGRPAWKRDVTQRILDAVEKIAQ